MSNMDAAYVISQNVSRMILIKTSNIQAELKNNTLSKSKRVLLEKELKNLQLLDHELSDPSTMLNLKNNVKVTLEKFHSGLKLNKLVRQLKNKTNNIPNVFKHPEYLRLAIADFKDDFVLTKNNVCWLQAEFDRQHNNKNKSNGLAIISSSKSDDPEWVFV